MAWQADRISRSAASDRVPPSRLSDAAAIAKARLAKHLAAGLVRILHPLTQSMVFFTSGGTEELYSGVTISTP